MISYAEVVNFSLARLIVIGLVFTCSRAQANVVGSDTQNFNPTTSGLDFVTVHSSETLKPGVLNFGFFLNYAVNSLPYLNSNSGQTRTNFNDSLLGADLNFGLGLMRNWDMGVSVPQVLSQSVDSNTGARGQFAENGLTEVRLNTKYRVWGDDSRGVALIASANFNQTQDNPYVGRGGGPTFNFEAAADQTFGDIAVGANLGYRLRDPGTPIPGIGILPIEDQFIASAAASYLFRDYDTKLIFEIFGAVPTSSGNDNFERQQSSLEALLGAKYDVNPHLAAHLGGGTELIHGQSSPDWRIYAGLNYTIGPLFSKESPVQQTSGTDSLRQGLPFSGEPQAPVETFVVRDILFGFDSENLEDSAKETLDRLAAYLNKPPVFIQLEIAGHSDSIGAAEYNLELSQRRARTVKRYLIETHGIDTDKVAAVGFGEKFPIADNGNFQGRALNRRVEFKITRRFNTEASQSPPKDAVTPDPNDPAFRRTQPSPAASPKKRMNRPASRGLKKPGTKN